MAAKNKPLCERIVELFQKNLGMGNRLNLTAEPFDQIGWDPVSLVGAGPKARRCSSLDKAVVDLDNDGALDLVIKTTFCMKGTASDSFYMFPSDANVLEQATWQDLRPLLATSDKFERTGGTYPLTALPLAGSVNPAPTLNTVFSLQPFIVDEQTYVALTDGIGQWVVVAKYLRGQRFEDQCYVQIGKS